MFKKVFSVIIFCLLPVAFAQANDKANVEKRTVFIEAENGFDTYITAAFTKKETPLIVVVDKAKADYTLHSAAVTTHKETTGGKVVRCIFADCIGIEDSANTSVELINNKSSAVEWSYNVGKQRGGSHNEQSMAEAIAKHLKSHLNGTGK